jgi:signal transduction histidine kinase
MDRAPEQEIDVHDGIEITLRILDHKIKKGTQLVREYDRDLPRICVPAGELNQVWTNLIDNAIDAAGADGRERCRGTIAFQSEPGDTRFWVRLPLDSQ